MMLLKTTSVLRVSGVRYFQKNGISGHPYKEVIIPVPWGKIAGKWWGSTKIKPILCLHGIQDNCGSFEPLINFLDKNENLSFLAVDFPGHGHSSPFSGGTFYHFFTFPMVVKRITDFFKWSNVSLMGHSMGAISAFTYCLLYPENVKFLICIDALQPFRATVSAEILKKSIDQLIKYDDWKVLQEESIAYSIEEATDKFIKGYNGAIKPERIPVLLERNLAASKKHPGKYYFNRDPKLKMKVMCDWPPDQIIKDVHRITQPIFICKAKHNRYYGPKENFYDVLDVLKTTSKDCDFHYCEGTHFLHMNNPEIVGTLIKKFLKKHHIREDNNLVNISSVFCDSQGISSKI